MEHPPGTSAIDVELADVLWCTRGKQWPYAIIFRPLLEVDHDWEVLLWRVFLTLSPEARPQQVSDTVRRNGVTRAYLATVFLDPVRVDADGLPISHRIVWFPPGEESPRVVAPDDWGPRFVAALRPVLDTVFNTVFNTVLRGALEDPVEAMRILVAREAWDIAQPLRFEGPTVMVCAQRPFDSWRGELPDAPPERWQLVMQALLLWAGVFALIALVVFLLRRAA